MSIIILKRIIDVKLFKQNFDQNLTSFSKKDTLNVRLRGLVILTFKKLIFKRSE